MNSHRLTAPAKAANFPAMRERSERRWFGWAPVLGAVALGSSGCVSVKAPEEPIVIELNINIKQGVVYRLAEDAGNTIQQNPDIF